MNELEFLKVIGKIDSELIKEADIEQKKSFSKRKIYALGSVAAVAAIAVGSVFLFNSYHQSGYVADDSIIQPDKNGDNLQTVNSFVTASSVEELNLDSSKSENIKDESVNDFSEQTSTDISNQNISSAPNNSTPQITESQLEHHPDTQSVKGYYQPFSATIDPDTDSFSKDELEHIDIRTSNGFYRQLAPDEYASNGISDTVSTTDFGEYIGKIVEVNNSYDYHGNAAESQEPTLAGAEVYCYAPKGNNKAFIIVKQNDQCSIFIADEINTGKGFRNGLSFFNVQGAEDIKSVEYQKRIPDDDGKMILSEQNIITDNTKVEAFYALICQLKPEDYSDLPEFAATPQWYIDAWDKYKADPDAFVMEDYSIIITLKDGTVLHEIRYQPFLANGYVDNMQELTPEQNSALKNLLK